MTLAKRRTRAWRGERRSAPADLLLELRHRLGDVSQEKLASRVGVSWSTISRWENGKGTPSPLAREKLIALLKEAGLEDRIDDLDVSR